MEPHWSVTVERNGELVVTLSSNHLSGRELDADDVAVLREAAKQLLAFAGAKAEEPPR